MNKEFLPIGSVCLLKGAKKKVMITGFCVKGNETGERVFDYLACVYPEGVISSDQNLLFDHEQIDQIFFKGFVNEEEVSFKTKLNEALSQHALENIESLDSEELEEAMEFNEEVLDMDTPIATIVPEGDNN